MIVRPAPDEIQRAQEHGAYDLGAALLLPKELDEHVGVWTLLGVSEEDAMSDAGLKVVQPADR